MSETIEEAAKKRRDLLLDIAIDEIGKARVGMGNDDKFLLETVPIDATVGIPGIDEILGGGWRRGRIGMVVGEATMGKTLLTQWTIAAFQALGYSCGFIDPEKTFDAEWFTRTGVDCEKLIVVRPSYTEQAFDLAIKWVEARIDLIIIDSLAALTPQDRLEKDLSDQEFMGLSARKISDGLNKLNNTNIDSVVLCTNQLRSKIGVVYGSPDEIPGGRSQKFYSSYLIKVSRGGWIKEGSGKDAPRIGYKLKLTTNKCRFVPPYQTDEVPFMFTGLVDGTAGTIDLAVDLELIPKSARGGYYTWKGETYHGMEALKGRFIEYPEDMEELKELIAAGDGLPDFGEEYATVT